MIYTKIEINGTEVIFDDCKVKKSLGEINSVSTFQARIMNYKGQYSSSFNIGDEVKIYVEKDVNPPTQQIFLGILEDIKLTGKELNEILTISGRDYTARLVDRTVEPEVYNNELAGDIVKDILSKYCDDVTDTNVADGIIIDRIVFNHTPVYDAIKQLAELCGFIFYIDNSKDLHFKEGGTTSSGYTFNGTNILSTSFKERRNSIFNEVWVYGDRYLDSYNQTLVADGAGSVFTLLYKPHNTSVYIGSGTSTLLQIQPGGIYQMTYGVGSNVKYLVNYDDKQIIFTSGTEQGNNIPKAGSNVVVDYYRDLPIVKVGENDASIDKYGRRVKVVQDTNIKDPLSAEAILLRELDEYSDPVKEGQLKLKDIDNLNPGDTCIVNIPIYGIANVVYQIIECTYDMDSKSALTGDVLEIKVNKKIPDITDTLKDILLQLKKLQGKDFSDSDLLTRYKWSTGSMGIRQSGCLVYTRSIVGDVLIYNSPIYGVYNTQKYGGVSYAFGFTLGNLSAAILGTTPLGSGNLGNWTLQYSGGYF